MTSSSTGTRPILLAFSGGLDTSFCVPWLADTYGRPIITLTVDTGGIDSDAARQLEERSRAGRRRPISSTPGRATSTRCCAFS